MRRWSCFAAALLLAVTVVACGDGDEASETTATTPTTAAPATIPSTAELDAMLLTADDIEGWQVGAAINEEDLAASAQVPCEDVDLAEAVVLDPTIVERLTADAGIQFDRTDDQYTHLIEWLITGDAEQLGADLDAYLGAFQSCVATWSTIPPPPPVAEELTLPELSDQQWAYSITVPSDGVRGYSAYVRVGTVAVGLGVMEPQMTNAEPQIGDEEFVQLLETAVAKVSG